MSLDIFFPSTNARTNKIVQPRTIWFLRSKGNLNPSWSIVPIEFPSLYNGRRTASINWNIFFFFFEKGIFKFGWKFSLREFPRVLEKFQLICTVSVPLFSRSLNTPWKKTGPKFSREGGFFPRLRLPPTFLLCTVGEKSRVQIYSLHFVYIMTLDR